MEQWKERKSTEIIFFTLHSIWKRRRFYIVYWQSLFLAEIVSVKD
jgi:hypothetical protein